LHNYQSNASILPSIVLSIVTIVRLCCSTFGQESDWAKMKTILPRSYFCGIASQPIQIDGKLDEESWRNAAWTDEFVDIEGGRKPAPKFRTRAKMLWDSEYFYVAAELVEPHLQGTITEHDAVIFQDNDFEVFIDPDGDNHEYYELELNALNTTWDLFLPRPYKDGGSADNGWEFRGLKTAVHLEGTLNDPTDQDSFWSVEIAIPWSAFVHHSRKGGSPLDGDTWRIDFSRVQWQFEIVDGKYKKVANTKEDNWVWSPQGIIDMHRPERWGFVQFSTALPNKISLPNQAPFAVDSRSIPRDFLMEVYHRQKTFHEKTTKWAKSLSELGFAHASEMSSETFAIDLTEEGYQAWLIVTNADQSREQWNVRQDSKLWKSVESELVKSALERSGENRSQLRRALDDCPIQQREAMEFLIANMPERDLLTLKSEFLLEEVRMAYLAWDTSPWKKDVPKEIFFNNVLPYANINERRDSWRKDFHERFQPLMDGAKTPAQAAARLNQKLFPLLNVRYSTQRLKADQSPYESIQSGTASCSGLSVLLIDACRALGVPARFVGTPLWSDNSGNHSWVEIWDNGWHFTGAAEPSGDDLDKAWFLDRASTAKRDDPMNAIYAVSFQKTPVHFPLVWDRSIKYINAVNVTDRYLELSVKSPEGTVPNRFRILDNATGKRIATLVRVFDQEGAQVFEGISKDERFDANDHLSFNLPVAKQFRLEIQDGKLCKKKDFVSEHRDAPISETIGSASDVLDAHKVSKLGARAVESLTKYVLQPALERSPLLEQPFANVPLSKNEAEEAKRILWTDHVARIRESRTAEMKAQVITLDGLKMPFATRVFGEKPANGRSLFISMHGGGGAPTKVNDQQWENQKKLYQLEEGVYLAPRAPTDTWDLWHQSHIDRFFDRLIENLIVLEEVDPNRIYLLGYSAGGDGVYQLAPRMADRFAAVSMMAGHPNETSPLGLRNLPFSLHMGEKDTAYNRNQAAVDWEVKMAELHRADPLGYRYLVKIHPGKGHWMDREDAVAIAWMANWTRNPTPDRIVWKQDDVVGQRFYWLAIDAQAVRERAELVATRADNTIDLQSNDVERVTVRMNDDVVDLDRTVSIRCGDARLFEGMVSRTIGHLSTTLNERGDPRGFYSAEVTVAFPKP